MIDLHTHSDFSDGSCNASNLIDKAIDLGIAALAITDHYDPFDSQCPYANHSPQSLNLHFANIKNYAAHKKITVFCGIETSTDNNGKLTLPVKVINMCDIIITSVHYLTSETYPEKGDYFNKAYWQQYKDKLLSQASGQGHVLGHPEAYLPIKHMLSGETNFKERLDICSQISQRCFDAAFIDMLGAALLKSNKAYELHGASGTPREWVVARLGKMGVKFSIGSDAHGIEMLGCNQRACDLVKQYNLQLFIPKPVI